MASPPTNPVHPRRPFLAATLASTALGTLVAAAWPGQPLVPPQNRTQTPVESRLDPNHAPWWQLERLPGVGPALAHAIVDERDRRALQWPGQPAFSRPDSLLHVHGLGRRKLEPMLAYLRFDPDPAQAGQQPASVDTTPPPP